MEIYWVPDLPYIKSISATLSVPFWYLLTALHMHDLSNIYIDYFIESATYGILFTSCKTLENERVSAANE